MDTNLSLVVATRTLRSSLSTSNRRLQFETLEDRRLLAVVLYRINAGGGEIADSPAWSSDSNASPSAYSNLDEGGNSSAFSTAATIDMTTPSIPSGTPMALFQSERFDKPGGANLSRSFFIRSWSKGAVTSP